MYNIGDKVRVREDLIGGRYYGNLWFDKDMEKFIGLIGEISVNNYNYYIKFDNIEWNDWLFNDEMLEPADKIDTTTKRKGIAQFHKVSFEQFEKDWKDTFENEPHLLEDIKGIYDAIKLSKRATVGSAGYDFFSPIYVMLQPNETIKIPTGIRVEIDNDWVLKCYPRSGLGFKYMLRLANVTGIIDADYFYSDNEDKIVFINQGDGFMQGIFVQYGITIDDDATGVRNGGFNSTSGKCLL